jgi:hypothetical protein
MPPSSGSRPAIGVGLLGPRFSGNTASATTGLLTRIVSREQAPNHGAALDAGSASCYTSGVSGPARVSAGRSLPHAITFMKTNLANFACGFMLLGALATTSAQTTWSYFISDAGGGNSLLTWNVTGSLATPPGAVRVIPDPNLRVSLSAPGIFAGAFAASGGDLPAPDGSYIQWEIGGIYSPIVSYSAYNAPGSGNDTFGLLAWLGPRGAAGVTLLYQPGTESALIPIDYSSFSPGAYQSEVSEFGTPLRVTLTVGTVPEPSPVVLFAAGGLSGLLLFRRSKGSFLLHRRFESRLQEPRFGQ